ncbi:MAG: hypothetical protein P8I55_14985 [Crocinitomix sp.]|nr:hypothetical protein [Crocinitomix sp.]
MTNRYLLLFFFTIALISNATGQGSGKLIINADLTSIASYDPDIEVSVINMATNREVLRNSVLENFNYTFPLNGRFMLYFKKSGATSTRLLLDTRTFMSGYYTLSFHLSLGNTAAGETASTMPIGTIKFDRATTSFGYKASNLLANQPLEVVSSIRESDVIRF